MNKPTVPTARDLMTTHVRSIPIDCDIDAAVRLLLRNGDSGAPVVDAGGAPRGVLSELDCIRVLAEAIADRWPVGKVTDHMTREIKTASSSDDVFILAARFADGRCRRLLVVEDDRLVGLITRRDLLRALASLDEEMARQPRPSTYEVLEQRRRELD